MLKRNCLAAVFEAYFEFQSKQAPTTAVQKRAVIHYRDDETMYVSASSDRVTVIFSTVFKDADDNIIGRVFMEVSVDDVRSSGNRPISFEVSARAASTVPASATSHR